MTYEIESLARQRAVLAAGVALIAVIFWRGALDVFSLPKWTALVLLAIVLAAMSLVRAVRTGRVQAPRSPSAIAAAVFAGATLVCTFASSSPMRSFVGRDGRYVGASLYLACVVVFFVALGSHRDRQATGPVSFARGVLGASAVVGLYGTLQVVGAEPLSWGDRHGADVFSTLGNPNFCAAWLGIALPLLVWRERSTDDVAERWLARACLALAVITIVGTTSAQGPIVAGATLATFAVLCVRRSSIQGPRGRWLLAGAAGTVLLGIVLVAGPLRSNIDRSFETRTPKWRAALELFDDHPVVGGGFGSFANHFASVQSARSARDERANAVTDAPHDVPLGFLAEGGLVVTLPYLAFSALVLLASLLGLRRLEGDARMAAGAVIAALVGYHVQSLVSIDHAPLAVLQWSLSGVALALTTVPSAWVVTLRRANRGARRRQQIAPIDAPVVVAALVGAVVGFVALAPLRAGASAGGALHDSGLSNEARVDRLHDASGRAWWEPTYPLQLGSFERRAKDLDAARAAFDEALRRDDRWVPAVIGEARTAVSAGRVDDALRWYARATELDPHSPSILIEAATIAATHEHVTLGRRYLARVEEARPRRLKTMIAYAKAYEAVGDDASALRVYKRALKRHPGDKAVQKEIDRLSTAP